MSRAARRVPALLAAAALAAAGCSVVQGASRSDTARAQVGDCIEVIEGSATTSRTEPVDCGSDRAVYTVVSTSPAKGDCGPERSSYEESFRGGTTAFLCLAPNLKQGGCYHQDRENGFARADCAAAEATVRVVARIDGRADESLCAPPTTYLLLSEPKTTYCMENPKS
ncbi:hypothetical protein BJY24_001958 [Nocardia transvalensis]|uniref:Lipoprotein n=1 Tax=Nocardia transvalensis TaxID=37333 RepID=A0A7W9PBJ2_9NOCA|nr:hypothetical protein [Nocardia transvalensis]MBB5913091.1 hypothetical protein [Nocardia transvalensis]